MAAQTFRHAAQLSASVHRLLDRILAMLALLYNAALEERIQAYCRSGKSISLYDQYKSLTEIRQDHADWRAISVLVARSALARLDRAMKAFFARAQSGAEPGFPRFRARSRYRSFSIEDPKAARSAVRILDGGQRGELRMKGLPRMRFAIRRALPPMDRLRSFHVVRKARRVEVQLVFERTHRCSVCGLELDRDENAARNVMCRCLRIFAGTAAAGGTAKSAPAASAARYMQE